jgi:hypothetical protein
MLAAGNKDGEREDHEKEGVMEAAAVKGENMA